MRTVMTFLAVALAVGSAACKKKDKDQPATGSGSAMMGSSAGSGSDTGSAAMGSGSAAMAAGSGSGSAAMGSGADQGSAAPAEPEMLKKAGNCPSTVLGAVSKAEVKGKDVVLTITSPDKDAVMAIQKRTELLLKEKQEGGTGAAHDQKGTQGGARGICPVFYGEGGTAKSKKDAKGVTIVITPKEKPEELKTAIDERIAKSAAWVDKNIKPGEQGNTGGVGGGKGEHGSRHQGAGDSKGKDRKEGTGGGAGTGGGGGKGTGGGAGDKKDKAKGG